jgi:hypothetical protein
VGRHHGRLGDLVVGGAEEAGRLGVTCLRARDYSIRGCAMPKVLIPFTDAKSAERAIRQLLLEPTSDTLEVELLAIAEPPELHNVRRFVSARAAEEAARSAATCWIAMVAPLLQAAHVAYKAHVVVGSPRTEIEAALHRTDVDRVLLPIAAPRWPDVARPVTLVA